MRALPTHRGRNHLHLGGRASQRQVENGSVRRVLGGNPTCRDDQAVSSVWTGEAFGGLQPGQAWALWTASRVHSMQQGGSASNQERTHSGAVQEHEEEAAVQVQAVPEEALHRHRPQPCDYEGSRCPVQAVQSWHQLLPGRHLIAAESDRVLGEPMSARLRDLSDKAPQDCLWT